MTKSPGEIVLGPVITERSYAMSQQGRYTFRVAPAAGKIEIRRAIEEHYEAQGVKVKDVNTISVRGKARRSGRGGAPGRTADWKKAIVTLAEGQKLEGLYGNV